MSLPRHSHITYTTFTVSSIFTPCHFAATRRLKDTGQQRFGCFFHMVLSPRHHILRHFGYVSRHATTSCHGGRHDDVVIRHARHCRHYTPPHCRACLRLPYSVPPALLSPLWPSMPRVTHTDGPAHASSPRLCLRLQVKITSPWETTRHRQCDARRQCGRPRRWKRVMGLMLSFCHHQSAHRNSRRQQLSSNNATLSYTASVHTFRRVNA